MEADNIDAATRTVLAARLVKDQALLTTLTVQKEELEATVDAAKAQCAALYTPENLFSLIQSKTPEANDVRLRLRAEIRRRISRINIDFNATFNDDGTVVCEVTLPGLQFKHADSSAFFSEVEYNLVPPERVQTLVRSPGAN
jgi:hypothetical protein